MNIDPERQRQQWDYDDPPSQARKGPDKPGCGRSGRYDTSEFKNGDNKTPLFKNQGSSIHNINIMDRQTRQLQRHHDRR